MAIDKELIDKLLADYQGPEDLIGEQGLLKQLTKALVERAMQAELTHHLGDAKHDPAVRGRGNAGNGVSKKTLKGFGSCENPAAGPVWKWIERKSITSEVC
jgi:putative transposase